MDFVRFRSTRLAIVPPFQYHYFSSFGIHHSLLFGFLHLSCAPSSFMFHILFHPLLLTRFLFILVLSLCSGSRDYLLLDLMISDGHL